MSKMTDIIQDRRILRNAYSFIDEYMNKEKYHVESIKFRYPNKMTEMVLSSNKDLRESFLTWKQLPLDTKIEIHEFYGGDCFGIEPQLRDLRFMFTYLSIQIIELELSKKTSDIKKLDKELEAELKNFKHILTDKVGIEKMCKMDYFSDMIDDWDFDFPSGSINSGTEKLMNEYINAKSQEPKEDTTSEDEVEESFEEAMNNGLEHNKVINSFHEDLTNNSTKIIPRGDY